MSGIDIQIAADKPYAVLELYDEFESNVYAVPACTAWLKNVKVCAKGGKQVTIAAQCKWPPDESKLSDYLEKKKKPIDTWITYNNVKILKFCTNNKNNKTSLFFDDDDTFSDNCTTQTQNAASFSKSTESQISDAIYLTYSSIDESVNESNSPLDHIKKKEKYNVQKNLETNKQDKVVVSEYENSDDQNSCTVIQDTCKINVNSHKKSPVKNNGCTDFIDTRKTYVNPHKKSPVKNNAGFNERTIMAAINDLRSRIDKLHVTVIKIYTATCHPEETLDNSIGFPTLPLTSMEAFYEWEDFNLDEEKKLIMIRLLVEHGREDLKGSVYSIMRKLMTNKVAVNFNLKGTNREGAKIQKKKFQNTTSYGLVIAALKRHSRERTDRGLHFLYNREIVDSHIGNWLKDAKKRLENEELRLQKSERQELLENENE